MADETAHIGFMSAHGFMPNSPMAPEETAEAKAQRLSRESDWITDARASVAAGRTCSLEAVTAWVHSWDTDDELASPHAGR